MNGLSLLCDSQAIGYLFSVQLNEDDRLFGTECQPHIISCSKIM